MLGADEFQLVRGWPADGPSLHVGGGSHVDRAVATNNLAEASCSVVDLSALAELAQLNQLGVLAALPNPMVTSATRDFIEQELSQLDNSLRGGRMFLHEGKLGFMEFDDESRAQERRFLESIRNAIKEHTTVIPAYGPADVNEVLEKLDDIVSGPEYSSLLAALEHGALLVSLDARMLIFAVSLGLRGVWLQAMLMSMRNAGHITPLAYAQATISSLLRRRSFVSIDEFDLEVALYQGQGPMSVFLNRLREYLADAGTEFASAWNVVEAFLVRLNMHGTTQFGAFLELFGYLFEAMLHHKDCLEDFDKQAVERIETRLEGAATPKRKAALVHFAARAMARRKHAMLPVELKARVLYCTEPPYVRNGLTDSDLRAMNQEQARMAANVGGSRASSTGTARK